MSAAEGTAADDDVDAELAAGAATGEDEEGDDVSDADDASDEDFETSDEEVESSDPAFDSDDTDRPRRHRRRRASGKSGGQTSAATRRPAKRLTAAAAAALTEPPTMLFVGGATGHFHFRRPLDVVALCHRLWGVELLLTSTKKVTGLRLRVPAWAPPPPAGAAAAIGSRKRQRAAAPAPADPDDPDAADAVAIPTDPRVPACLATVSVTGHVKVFAAPLPPTAATAGLPPDVAGAAVIDAARRAALRVADAVARAEFAAARGRSDEGGGGGGGGGADEDARLRACRAAAARACEATFRVALLPTQVRCFGAGVAAAPLVLSRVRALLERLNDPLREDDAAGPVTVGFATEPGAAALEVDVATDGGAVSGQRSHRVPPLRVRVTAAGAVVCRNVVDPAAALRVARHVLAPILRQCVRDA